MKETEHIKILLEDLYNGDPWLGISIIKTLENISAETAAKKIAPHWNSIWEIVQHMSSWRLNVLSRVKGNKMESPADNYFTPVMDQSPQAWQNTLQALEDSQQQWINMLQQMKEEDLERIYPGNEASYYYNIHGIIQHDAYHLGQIVLLAKGL